MNKVLGNVLAQFLGKVLTVCVAFVSVKIISGFGREFYGSYVTAYEFLAFFGVLADMGLFAIAVRDMSQKTKMALVKRYASDTEYSGNLSNETFVLGNILSIRFISVVLATVLAGVVAQWVPGYAPMVKWGIWITGLSMSLTIIAGTLSSVLQAKMKIQYFSGSLAFGKILLALMIFVIASFSGYFALEEETLFFAFLLAGVLSNIVFCLLTFYFVRKMTPVVWRFDVRYWKKILKTSLPYGVALILQTLYLRADLVLISILLGAEAVGVYGVSARIMESFLVLGVFFGQSMLPKLSKNGKDAEKSSYLLSWGVETLLIFSLPILIGVGFFSRQMVLWLSSSEFVSSPGFFGSDRALLILVPTVVFAYLNQLFSFALIAKNKQYFLLWTNAVGFLCNVGLNLYFLPRFGIIASAVSTVVCEILVFLFLFRKTMEYFRFYLNYKKIGLILFLNVLVFLMIFLTNGKENFILAVALSSFIYLGGLWLFRSLVFAENPKA